MRGRRVRFKGFLPLTSVIATDSVLCLGTWFDSLYSAKIMTHLSHTQVSNQYENKNRPQIQIMQPGAALRSLSGISSYFTLCCSEKLQLVFRRIRLSGLCDVGSPALSAAPLETNPS